MKKLIKSYEKIIEKIKSLDFIGLLLLRIYLAPIFIIAGLTKLNSFSATAEWFGNPEWGLGLPMPTLMTGLVIFAELIGGWALLFGVFTRFFAFVLAITMAVAGLTVHLQHGWFAIASADSTTSIAVFWSKLGFDMATESLNKASEVANRLDKAKEILQEHGNYEWLTEMGNFVILNNGVEFAVTYLLMLLPLLFYGAGRYVSVDYFVGKRLFNRSVLT